MGVKLIAHRGYAVHAPQNSLEAFETAGRLGYWAIETDVHKTLDGVLVCNVVCGFFNVGVGGLPLLCINNGDISRALNATFAASSFISIKNYYGFALVKRSVAAHNSHENIACKRYVGFAVSSQKIPGKNHIVAVYKNVGVALWFLLLRGLFF